MTALTAYPYIRFRDNGSIQIRIPNPHYIEGVTTKRLTVTISPLPNETLEERLIRALEKRDELLVANNLPVPGSYPHSNLPMIHHATNIEGPGAKEEVDLETIVRQAENAFARQREYQQRRAKQFVRIETDLPVCIAFFADLHLGNPGTDIVSIMRDAELVRTTPDIYSILLGDITDNWLPPGLQHLQRKQAVNQQEEIALALLFITKLAPKLIAVVDGNHDLWTNKMAGLSFLRDALKDLKLIYDDHGLYFPLQLGSHASWNILVRHKYKGGSGGTNQTAALENAWNNGAHPYDLAIGGHIHTATICREFIRQGKVRYAIQLGSYKRYDDYADEIGFAPSTHTGSGAVILFPNGRLQWFQNLAIAAATLPYYQEQWRNGTLPRMFEQST